MFRRSAFKIPALMYHRIADPIPGDRTSRKYAVSPRLFESQMRYLAWAGYQPISMSHVGESMMGERPLPRKPVVITFDDGYVDTYTHAVPILRKFGFTATIYIVTGLIGRTNEWDISANVPVYPLMNLEQIRELGRQGFDIGAHTLTHPHLTLIPPERAAEEVWESGALLEKLIGLPIRTFCYPYGPTSVSRETRRMVAESGYIAACGTHPACNYSYTDRYALNRFWPKDYSYVPRFAAMLCRW